MNPFSGSGRSVKTFYDKVEPMLNEADIDFDAVTTGDLIHSINFICYLTYPFLLVLTFVAGIHSKRHSESETVGFLLVLFASNFQVSLFIFVCSCHWVIL